MGNDFKDLKKTFLQAGWEILREGKGSHVIFGKGVRRVAIPKHKEMGKGLKSKLKKLAIDEYTR